MPVQNSNSKTSARPDLATDLLQILIPTTYNSLLCLKGQFILQLCSGDSLLGKYVGYYPPIFWLLTPISQNRKFSM